MAFSSCWRVPPERRVPDECGIDGSARQGGFRRPARQWSGFRCSTRPRRCGTYPGLRRPLRSARCGLARSSLKMKRVDPARARVSASHGGCDAAGLQGHNGIGSQVEPAACEGSVLCFRSAIHLHGPTPHRESRVVSGHRAERHAAEPIRGKHDHVPRHSRWNGRCSKEWREQVRRHQVPGTTSAVAATRFRSARRDRRQVADMDSTNDYYRAATSGVTAGPIRGSGLQRRIRTATPFAPHGAGHQEGRRELSVDTRRHAASRRRCRNRRVSPGLTGGVVTALDAAPFSDRCRPASRIRG